MLEEPAQDQPTEGASVRNLGSETLAREPWPNSGTEIGDAACAEAQGPPPPAPIDGLKGESPYHRLGVMCAGLLAELADKLLLG